MSVSAGREEEVEHAIRGLWIELSRGLVGKHHDRTVRELLCYGRLGPAHLVKVDDRAEIAYLYHVEGRYVVAVAFDDDGLADGGPLVTSIGRRGSIRG